MRKKRDIFLGSKPALENSQFSSSGNYPLVLFKIHAHDCALHKDDFMGSLYWSFWKRVLQRRRGAPYGTVSGTHIAERIPARVKRQLKDSTFFDRNVHQQSRIAQRDRTWTPAVFDLADASVRSPKKHSFVFNTGRCNADCSRNSPAMPRTESRSSESAGIWATVYHQWSFLSLNISQDHPKISTVTI